VKHAQVAAFKLATQLNPVNRNFSHGRCNIIAKLNAAPLLASQSCTPACMELFEVYHMQSDCPAGTSALLAGRKHHVMHPVASGGSSLS